MGGGESSEPRRRVQQQGCRGQSRETPAQRIGTDQHSPAREACLLTSRDRLGLGAEAPVSEVRSQGEDWGWLREHSLKGASAPRLAGRESGKRSGTAEEARDHCFGVHEERRVRALPKQAPETGSVDTRDGHEMLRLLLQHQEACEQVQVTIHASPPQEPVQPATARVP